MHHFLEKSDSFHPAKLTAIVSVLLPQFLVG